jgi:hypothetical protein
MPLPGLAIQKQKPLHVYFEIYNLTLDSQNRANYEIEYSVRQPDGKAGLLAQIAGAAPGDAKSVTLREKRAGHEANPFERITLDLGALKAGKLELLIMVHDLNTGQQAKSSVPLRLEK